MSEADTGAPTSAEEGTSEEPAGGPWTPSPLAALRRSPAHRRVALVGAVLVGLGAAWLHWLGLLAAGVLVGLVSATLPRAILTGLAVGVLVLVVQVLASPAVQPGELLALVPVSYVTIGAALGLPLWGSLVRGVV